MIDLFIRQLERHTPLNRAEQAALRSASSLPRQFPAHRNLISEGECVSGAHVVLSGMACRYKTLPNGRRQILACFIPGDICGARACMLGWTDESIESLSVLETTLLPRTAIVELTSHHPQLLRALWIAAIAEEMTLREWLMNVGRRSAFERMAHFFCEIFARLAEAGLTTGGACELPLRQQDLADVLALTPVHVNRVLMVMRHRNLITLDRNHLTIHNLHALQSAAGFDPHYLHLGPSENTERDSRRVVEPSWNDAVASV